MGQRRTPYLVLGQLSISTYKQAINFTNNPSPQLAALYQSLTTVTPPNPSPVTSVSRNNTAMADKFPSVEDLDSGMSSYLQSPISAPPD